MTKNRTGSNFAVAGKKAFFQLVMNSNICRILPITLAALLSTAIAEPNDPQLAIEALITGEEKVSAEAAARLKTFPADSLWRWIESFSQFPAPDTTGWVVRLENRISDTLTAPAYLYIPTNYDPARPAPLMVRLHGGVGRPAFVERPEGGGLEDIFLPVYEELGALVLIPLGKSGLTWWDPLGIENIGIFIRQIKRHYNVDDNRVFIGGFSDGASGAYHWAMLKPTEFAAFFPWSGHPAVGSIVGGIQAYLPNMRNRPLFAAGGGLDELYPTTRLVPLYAAAMRAGARLAFTDYDTAHHRGEYLNLEVPRVRQVMNSIIRDPYSSRLYWETADLRFGGLDWLWITEMDTAAAKAEWHTEYNATLIDERLTIGFNPDREYEGKGIRLASVVDDTSLPAGRAGLKVGDILVELDDIKVKGIEDVNRFKEGKKRGDPLKMTIRRDGRAMMLMTAFPPTAEYPAFQYNQPSAAIRAARVGNVFTVETSRVKRFTLLLSDKMIHFSAPVTIIANGDTVYHGWVKPDADVLFDKFGRSGDRRAHWSARIDIVL